MAVSKLSAKKAKSADKTPLNGSSNAESPYRVLFVQRSSTSPIRSIYVRQHNATSEEEQFPPDRTIYAVGLPAWLNTRKLRTLVQQFGGVENVHLEAHSMRSSDIEESNMDWLSLGLATAAHVVFTEPKGMKKALKAAVLLTSAQSTAAQPMLLGDKDSPGGGGEVRGDDAGGASPSEEDPVLGLQGWLASYRAARPGLEVLEEEVNRYMAEYDAAEEKARLEREAQAAEEGWTMVVGKAGRKKATGGGIAVGAVAPEVAARAAEAQGTKGKQLEDFYRFQQKEKRRSELLDLQQKFEEDKKRIARLKAARKFRPY